MTNPRFKLSVLGAGAIARIILPKLEPHGVSVRGIFDVSGESARALAEDTPGARPAASIEEVLADPATDGVYIATPPSTHKDLIARCLAAGKPVVCEKPWSLNEAEARAIAGVCAGAPGIAVASCSSRFRFAPALRAVLPVLADGSLGRVRRVRLRANAGIAQPLENLPPWKREISSAGGGLVMDWGCYELDWLGGIFGEAFDPITVNAHFDEWRWEGTGLESGYTVHIQCRSGMVVELTRQSEVGPPRHDVEIRCERGGIDLPFAPSAQDCTVRLHRVGGDGKTVVTTDSASATAGDWPGILVGPLVNFAGAVAGREAVASDPASQIRVHRVLDAVLASGRGKHPVQIG